MTVTEKNQLVLSLGGKTRLFTSEEVKQALNLLEEAKTKTTFCAKYNREQEDSFTKACEKALKIPIVFPTTTWVNTHTAERIKTDPIVEAVREDLLRRSQLGIAKYGTLLTREDIDLKGWLQHAYEENLDMANYLKRTIIELEKKENGN